MCVSLSRLLLSPSLSPLSCCISRVASFCHSQHERTRHVFMLMLIAADMWQQKGNGIVHGCLLHVFYIVGYPTLSILMGLLFGEDSLTEAGFPLSVNLSSFSSARCVTCVCPYVRSLANAIALQLRNSNVNSCGLLCT